MPLPLLTRYGDTLRYDRERGLVLLLDRRRYPGEIVFVECADIEMVAREAEALAVQGSSPLAYLAGYGLALAARAWQGRPSEAQRAAIIQAGQHLRNTLPTANELHKLIAEGLARADAAILAGQNAEAAIVAFVAGEISRGDRVAERCGRIAAGLFDDGDRILAYGFAGPALNWMLYVAAVEQNKQIELFATEAQPDLQGARLALHQAQELGVPATLLAEATPDSFAMHGFSVSIAAAEQIAMDGSIANTIGTKQYAALVRRHNVPFYVLGYGGPDPAVVSGAIMLGEADATLEVTPPTLISAIVTNRGIYRPERIADYLRDGEAPLDIIPLS